MISALAAPVPDALQHYTEGDLPDDATLLEQLRDVVLGAYIRPLARHIFLGVAAIAIILCIVSASLMTFSLLGIYFGIENGWNDFDDACRACAKTLGIVLSPRDVPECEDLHVDACTENQHIYNVSKKMFIVCFSCTNFLAIPWRIAILHHAFCSNRHSDVGLDFYGRPTTAVWFQISRKARRYIAILVNLAWAFQFTALAAHVQHPTYATSQMGGNGFLFQTIASGLSSATLLLAVVIQMRAEEHVMTQARKAAGLPPAPSLWMSLLTAIRRWRAGQGGLVVCLRDQWLVYGDINRQYDERLLIKRDENYITKINVGYSNKLQLTADQAAVRIQTRARGMLARVNMHRRRAATIIQRSVKYGARSVSLRLSHLDMSGRHSGWSGAHKATVQKQLVLIQTTRRFTGQSGPAWRTTQSHPIRESESETMASELAQEPQSHEVDKDDSREIEWQTQGQGQGQGQGQHQRFYASAV